MLYLISIANFSLVLLLVSYQKNDKIYIGYTTVLSLLFGICGFGALGAAILKLNLGWFFLWTCLSIQGGLIIYLTHQLTLAFEKIEQLSQHIGLEGVDKSSSKNT